MLSYLLILALASAVTAAPSHQRRATGCGSVAPFAAGTFNTATFQTSDGTTREYGVWLPTRYSQNTQTRVIFSYHGASGTIDTQRALDELANPAFNTDHMVVYLQGLTNSDDKTTWEQAPGADADDVGFTGELMDEIESRYCVDTDRIYATGKSQGGGFVGMLACDSVLSTRFAAFAPVSGAYYNKDITSEADCDPLAMPIVCSPGRAGVPVMAFHGGADTTISYTGGFRKDACLPDIQYWVGEWVRRDGLDATPTNTSIAGSDGGIVSSYGGGLVTFVFDGWNIPHDWPATFENADNEGANLAAFNATSMIMDYFRAHSLN